MNQLELLWQLEIHKTSLEEINREFLRLSEDEKMDLLEEQVNSLKERTQILNNKLLIDSQSLKENHKRLKKFTYTINNMREELYSGEITDLKQLDYLNKEKDNLKEEINNIETDILISMDEIEKMELESLHIETEIISINGEIEKLKINKDLLLKQLEIQILEGKKESQTIASKIDKDLLDRFNTLRNTKQKAIVAVKNNICNGCNMRVATYLKDILKGKKEVIYCESCGRMLYYIENKSD